MKKLTAILPIMFFVFIAGTTPPMQQYATPSNESSLKVKVSGVKSTAGYVHVLLFNQAMGFPTNSAKAYKHVKAKAVPGEVTINVDNIAYGTYSIVAFHDTDADGEFDRSWFGSPQEDYGFSNIPGEFCGTPSFQQTSFRFAQASSTIAVKLMNVD
jgi:uncharacterized protein (DUF2141 family)